MLLVSGGTVIESEAYRGGSTGFDPETMLESMFDEITPETAISSGGSERTSYMIDAAGTTLVWAVHIVDYESGDSVRVAAYDMFGNELAAATQTGEIQFYGSEIEDAGTLDIEVENTGSEPVVTVLMFSENPDDSEMFTDPDSPLNRVLIPLLAAGVMMLIGLIVVVAGITVFLVDMRRQRSTNRFGGYYGGGRGGS